ncbi:hypothetical protein GA0061098_1018181 [Bradyrhizobium shewense]|uniref:Uncharacterized protein n=1 Tax=Bradyrhizobium shewense TaxID=1761772 RepID=A0A1C3XM44_9BRAD|nr:hypothetical protein GA0061098_1018181 [Bradyrhizobium shewense]
MSTAAHRVLCSRRRWLGRRPRQSHPRGSDRPRLAKHEAAEKPVVGIVVSLGYLRSTRIAGLVIQLISADRAELEVHQVVGGDGARVPPMPVDREFSEIREAPPTSKSSVVAARDDNCACAAASSDASSCCGSCKRPVECSRELVDAGEDCCTRTKSSAEKLADDLLHQGSLRGRSATACVNMRVGGLIHSVVSLATRRAIPARVASRTS